MNIFKKLAVAAGFAAALGVAHAASAQTVTTAAAPDNSAQGLMYEVEASAPLNLTSVSADISTDGDYTVYGRPGSYVGASGSDDGWLEIGSAVEASGLTTFEITTPEIAAGATYAIYIASDDDTGGVSYGTDGVIAGATVASDDNLAIKTGVGKPTQFSAVDYSPVAPVGSVSYVLVPAPEPIPTLSEWAMILLGLTLAGGALLMIQRKPRAI